MRRIKLDESLLDKLSGPSIEEVENDLRKKFLDGSIDIFQYNKKAKELNVKGPTKEDYKLEYDRNGDRFLEQAIQNGDEESANYAIDNGIDINNSFRSFLFHAVLYNQVNMVKLLINRGIEYSTAAFRTAYEKDKIDKEIIDLLEKHFHKSYEEFVKENPDDHVRIAMETNDLDELKKAVENGGDVNNGFGSNIANAIYKKNEAMVIYLILHGGKIDKYVLDAVKNNGTPLIKQIFNYY